MEETTAPLRLLAACRETPRQFEQLTALSKEIELVTAGTPEQMRECAAGAEALLMWSGEPELLRAALSAAPSIRWVHSKSAGIEPLLIAEMRESQAVLTNARGVYAQSLAEFVLAGMLYFAKDMPRMLANKRAGVWEQFAVDELSGCTLGIYGYGAIGAEIAARAKAFEMTVLGLRRRPERSSGDLNAERVLSFHQLDEVLPELDYLAIAAPDTPETRGAIGAPQLAALQSGAVVINVGRGSVLDETALIDALAGKRIRGAVLDVFAEEPLPPESPLWKLDNVFLSPHTADQTATWLDESMALFVDNVKRYIRGEELQNVCSKELGY